MQKFLLTLGLFLLPLAVFAASDLKLGDAAPKFSLLDQNNKQHQLADYRGQWVLLYFYPKDDTPGCTTEACAFRDDIFLLRRMQVKLLGVSMDDIESHQEFAEKYQLPFSLLSDPKGEVADAYGSYGGFGPLKYAKRHSFIIDPAGKLAKIYRDVSPKTHSGQVIADLTELQKDN